MTTRLTSGKSLPPETWQSGEAIRSEDAGTRRGRQYGGLRRAWLLLAMMAIFVPSASLAPRNLVNDVITSSAAAWNLGVNGTLDLSTQGLDSLVWAVDNGHGLYPKTFPGTYLAAAPMYFGVRGLDTISRDPSEPARIPVWPASLAAALVAAIAVVLLVELLRSVVRPRVAIGVGLTAALATPFWSVAADALWTHGPAILWLVAALLAVSRDRLWWAGAFFGLAILARPTTVVAPLVMGLYLGWTRHSWRPVFSIGVASGLGLVSLSVYSRVLFDTWLPVTGYEAGRVGAALGTGEALLGPFSVGEQLWGFFFDTYRGVLIFTPLLVPAVIGAVWAWRRAPDWARASAVAGLVYIAIQLRANPFPGGYGFWGYRYPLEGIFLAVPLMAVGAQGFLLERRWWRRTSVLATFASFALILPGAIWFATKPEPWRPGYGHPDQAGWIHPDDLAEAQRARQESMTGAGGG